MKEKDGMRYWAPRREVFGLLLFRIVVGPLFVGGFIGLTAPGHGWSSLVALVPLFLFVYPFVRTVPLAVVVTEARIEVLNLWGVLGATPFGVIELSDRKACSELRATLKAYETASNTRRGLSARWEAALLPSLSAYLREVIAENDEAGE